MAEGSARARMGTEPRLHGELLATSLLAFLKGCNAYGYQLAQQLNATGLPQPDSGTVYRALRQLRGAASSPPSGTPRTRARRGACTR